MKKTALIRIGLIALFGIFAILLTFTFVACSSGGEQQNVPSEQQEDTPSTGHTHSFSWAYDDTYHWQECAFCDEKQNRGLHIYGEWTVDNQPTDDVDGKKHRVCSACGKVENENIPKTTYTITFNLNGGHSDSYVATKTVHGLNAMDFFFDVEKDGFNFRGWLCDGIKVFDENGELVNNVEMSPTMTFIAEWSNRAKLTIVSNIPEAGEYSNGGEYDYNTNVNLEASPYQGYEFVGWIYKGATLSNQLEYNHRMWDKDVVITAYFKLADFNLSIESNNADKGLVFINPIGISDLYANEKQETITYKDNVIVAAYTKTEVRFLGWFDNDGALVSTNAVYEFTMPNHDYHLVAKWDCFTISYDLDGGTQNPKNPTDYSTQMSNLPLYSPTKEQREFVGWEYNGQLISEINTHLADDITLTARWTYYTLTTTTNMDGAGTYSQYNNVIVTSGTSVTLTANSNVGYTWLGWYDGDTKVCDELTYEVNMPVGSRIYIAKWKIAIEMSNFSFISSTTNCTITGIKDKTVTEIVVPDYVTTIEEGAFSGCSLLKKITIPFVGAVAGKTSSDTYQYPFGYIFGTNSYTGGTAVNQYYYGSSTSSTTNTTYYIPSTLRNVTITGGNILCGAFYGCSMLTSVTIPDSVTSIGSGAFYNCRGLTSITIPDSVTSIEREAFSSCSGLTSITIPDSVTSIGDYAFFKCNRLRSVIIGNSVTSIGYQAFNDCDNLTTIDYIGDLSDWCAINDVGGLMLYGASNKELYINGEEVSGDLVIPNGVTSIGNSAFCKCSGLTSVIIQNNVTSIGEYAFHDCTSLTSITIPDNVTSIGNYAFYGCRGFTSITIPDSVTSIGDYAFYYCTGLTSATIGNSVTSVGGSAFGGCSGLTSVTIPNSVTNIGSYAFSGCTCLTSIQYMGDIASWCAISDLGGLMEYGASNKKLYINGEEITGELIIPNGITSIGRYAFYKCSGLTSITIPDSVTSIGDYVFYYCTGLTSATIGNSVTSVGDSAFRGCSSLTSVTGRAKSARKVCSQCGASVVTIVGGLDETYAFYQENHVKSITIKSGTIGNYAFWGCSNLTSITIGNGVTSISIGEDAFKDCSKLSTITVEEGNTVYHSSSNCLIKTNSKELVLGCKNSVIPIDGSVTRIGDSAFQNCTGLTSIVIPDCVERISYGAFSGCVSLESITIPFIGDDKDNSLSTSRIYPFGYIFGDSSYTGGTATIQYYDFSNSQKHLKSTYYIPSSLHNVTVTGGELLPEAFINCSTLTSITISENITNIGHGAFNGCSNLLSVSGLEYVTSIGDFAFKGCNCLTLNTFDNAKYLGVADNPYYVLVQAINNNITACEISKDCKVICTSAFRKCSELNDISIETGDSKFHVNGKCVIDTENKELILGINDFVIPTDGSVTSIGNYAFYEYIDSGEITIPSTITYIGDYALYDYSLSSINYGGSYAQWNKNIQYGKSIAVGNMDIKVYVGNSYFIWSIYEP